MTGDKKRPPRRASKAPHEAAEGWLTGPYLTLRQLRLLGSSLRDIQRRGRQRAETSHGISISR